MKQHASVFMLMIRSTLYPVLILLSLVVAAETGLFLLVLSRGITEDGFGPEQLVLDMGMPWIFCATFVLLTVLLCRFGSEGSSRCGYTIRRLRISERWVFFWQSTANLLFYLLFWSVQILICIGFCHLYTKMAPPAFVTNQTAFLAFYRSNFLHALLPFEDAAYWVRNGILAISLGICAARFPHGQRRGQRLPDILIPASFSIIFFARGIGSASCIVVSIVALICAVISVHSVLKQEAAYEA